MSDTAEATLEAVILGYVEKDPDALLAQLHDNIRVVGSKGHENWSSKDEVEEALRDELGGTESIGGSLTDLSAQELAERIRPSTYDELGLGWITEVGEVQFGEQTVSGRWSCVVERVGQGDWKVVQSHFSVPEAAETLS
jgi:hypothetical protein